MTKFPTDSALTLRNRCCFLAFVVSLFCVLTTLGLQSADAQTFAVLHNFNGLDGAFPQAGLTMAGTGNLYGTGYMGGVYGYGSVFHLRWSGSAWVFSDIYNFQGGNDGYFPISRLVLGPNNSLYSTTLGGGGGFCDGDGCGTFFKVQPPLTTCKTTRCDWTKTILYRFTDFHHERNPTGDLLFDSSGNVYGTGRTGGGFGMIYELMPSSGDWTVIDLHDFTYSPDGEYPQSGLIADNAGNLYGTATGGGNFGFGTAFELTPTGSGWVLTVLHAFQGASDGGYPIGGLVFDQSGNLYGTTSSAGSGGGGTVFELTPSGGGWSFNLIYGFHGSSGSGPAANLSWDGAGNLYGTTAGDGVYQHGSVFKLMPTSGGWSETDLYSFTGGSDGSTPMSNVTLDTNGNLYGTTSSGGANFCEFQNCGVVWEITP